MIELSTNTAVMLYLSVTLAILLGMWLYHNLKHRRKKILSSEQELYVCEYCHFVYLNDRMKEVNQCPQCSSFNKQNHMKR